MSHYFLCPILHDLFDKTLDIVPILECNGKISAWFVVGFLIHGLYCSGMKEDVVCPQTLILHTAMLWAMVQELSFTVEKLGWYHQWVILSFWLYLPFSEWYKTTKRLCYSWLLVTSKFWHYWFSILIWQCYVSRLGIWVLLLQNGQLEGRHWLLWWMWKGDMVCSLSLACFAQPYWWQDTFTSWFEDTKYVVG